MRCLFSTMDATVDGYVRDKKLALSQKCMHITQLYISTHFTQTPAHTETYGNLWHYVYKNRYFNLQQMNYVVKPKTYLQGEK